ncbi:MAG: acetoacetate decarboxylase family protein [Candidatus Binataceae bacterium]
MPVKPLPLYVEYGGLATTPQPDLIDDCVLYGFFPRADCQKLASLCKRVFAAPSGGAVNCVPLSDRVMLTFGRAAKVRPKLKPYAQMGYGAEKQVAFWIPVRVSTKGSAKQFPSLAWFVPYMWVDNPLSLCGGREIFGWAKNWGSMTLADESPKRDFTLHAYGGNYNPGSASGYFPLIAVTPLSVSTSKPANSRVDAVLEWLLKEAQKGIEEEFQTLFKWFAKSTAPIVFLKQFRSVSNGLVASVQEIAGTTTDVRRMKSLQPILTRHQLAVQPSNSHPIIPELGITNQKLWPGFEIKMDFTLQNGTRLWP